MMQLTHSLPTPPASRPDLLAPASVNNLFAGNWIAQCIELCKPDAVYWCDGSASQRQELYDRAVNEGVLIRLNQQKLPNCYLHRSNPNDVARTEQLTFICTPSEDMCGPTTRTPRRFRIGLPDTLIRTPKQRSTARQ